MQDEHTHSVAGVIELPRPTAWPIVLALGITLIFAGMLTNIAIAALGLVLSLAGAVGWFRQVLPHEEHEAIPVIIEEIPTVTTRTRPARETRHTISGEPRKILPVETFQITTGIRGGIAGGTAMVVPATLFSLIKYHSLWYAVNLLAAGGFVGWAGASDAFLSQFHLQGVIAGFFIQGTISLLVGLLYGALLPMFPRYPIVTAGFLVPLIFSGLIHSAIGIVSPILNQRIDWFWFVMSQIAFGLVCGYVVNLQARVRTPQFQALPFAVRAGLHTDLAGQPQHDGLDTEEKDNTR